MTKRNSQLDTAKLNRYLIHYNNYLNVLLTLSNYLLTGDMLT